MKRIVSFMLALLMLCVLIPVSAASAAEMTVETIIEPSMKMLRTSPAIMPL